MADRVNAPLLSVVINTFNKAATLERVLGALSRQEGIDPAAFEVVVHDDGSTDSAAGPDSCWSVSWRRVAERLPSPLPDASADAVLLIEVLEHLFPDHVAPTLDEARRLLPPGGLIVATTPNEETLLAETLQCPDCGCEFHRWQHLRRMSTETMEPLMADAGFARIVYRPTRFGPRRRRRWDHRQRDYVDRLSGRVPPESTPHLIFIGRRD